MFISRLVSCDKLSVSSRTSKCQTREYQLNILHSKRNGNCSTRHMSCHCVLINHYRKHYATDCIVALQSKCSAQATLVVMYVY